MGAQRYFNLQRNYLWEGHRFLWSYEEKFHFLTGWAILGVNILLFRGKIFCVQLKKLFSGQQILGFQKYWVNGFHIFKVSHNFEAQQLFGVPDFFCFCQGGSHYGTECNTWGSEDPTCQKQLKKIVSLHLRKHRKLKLSVQVNSTK